MQSTFQLFVGGYWGGTNLCQNQERTVLLKQANKQAPLPRLSGYCRQTRILFGWWPVGSFATQFSWFLWGFAFPAKDSSLSSLSFLLFIFGWLLVVDSILSRPNQILFAREKLALCTSQSQDENSFLVWFEVQTIGDVGAAVVVTSFCAFSNGLSTRPDVVNVGAVLSLDSDIGKHIKIAIEEGVKDVNSNKSVLQHTKLQVNYKSSNCSAFLGLTQAMKYMETDVVAIIGPQSSVVAHTILSIAQEFTTPFLSLATDPTLSSIGFPYFVRTTHSDRFQMMAVAEVVSHYGWKQVTVIYIDDDYGRNGLAALDDALYAKRCRVVYKAPIPPRKLDRGGIMDILVKVALMESRVIVVHVHRGVGLQVFSLAQDLGMSIGYVWIATDWLAAALDTAPPLRSQIMMNDLQGVLMLRQHTPDSERKQAFIAKWNKELAVGSLGLSTYALHAYDTVWLLAHAIDSFLNEGGNVSLSNDSKLKSINGSRLHLDKMLIFDDGHLLLKNILETEFVGLTGLIKFTSTRSLVFPAYQIVNLIGTGRHIIGYWSNASSLSVIAPELLNGSSANHSSAPVELNSVVWPGEALTTPRGWVFPNNGNLLKIGVPLRVGYKEFVSQDHGVNNFKGFCIDVFLAAIDLLPYAVPHKFIPFGNGRENPSYDELVYSITTGMFDGVVGDVTIVTNRTRVVDFTQPYAASGLVIVSSVKTLNSGAWSFLRPFSHELWGVCAAFFLLVGIVVWTLEHRTNNEFRGPPKRQMITILWFSFSTLFFAHRESTVSTLGRMVLLIWLFVVLIINSSYTASLTSILTLQQLYSPIKGIDTLKNSQDVVGYQVGSFSEQYLFGLGIPKSRLRPLGSLEEYATALERGPKRGGVDAVVDERPYVDLFLASQCEFRVIGEEFTKSGWGFAFARDSPLTIDMSTAILTLSENGDLQRIHDKWLTTSSCSSDNTEMQLQSNRLHLQSFWVLYAVTGSVCVIALVMHFCFVCCASRNNDFEVSRSNNPNLGESSRSKRMQNLWSLIDDKGSSRRERKRRRLEEIASQRMTEAPGTST